MSENGKVALRVVAADGKRPPPLRRKNERPRRYLTEEECRRLIGAARDRGGRYGARDALAIRMAWRHGLRAGEIELLTWGHVEWKTMRLSVPRLKGSTGSTQPISGDELRELRKLHRAQPPGTRHIFVTERGTPMNAATFRKMLSAVGKVSGLPSVHPHQLRHSCGFYLADRRQDVRVIQDWLGHKNIRHTAEYAKLAPGRLDSVPAPD
jgi:integrase